MQSTSNPSRNPHTLTGIKGMQATTKQKYLVSTNKLGTLLSSQTTDTQESTPRKPTHTTCKRRKITRTLHSRADTHTTTNFPKEQNQVNTQRPCRETLDGPQPGKQRSARYETPKPEQQQAASRGLKGYCPPDTPVTGTPSWRATGKYSTHTHTKSKTEHSAPLKTLNSRGLRAVHRYAGRA